MMDYEELLNRAKKDAAKSGDDGRFSLPEVEVLSEGNRTIIKNFSAIADTLRRDQTHMLKFMLKVLAVPGESKSGRASFTGSFTKRQLNDKIKEYARLFVFCYSCGKPDTHIKKEEGVEKLKCEACGKKSKLKA